MKLTKLFTDDGAVSPVVGVVLMVGITVILAAVVGSLIVDFGGPEEQPPEAKWSWQDYADADEVVLKHRGGDTVDDPDQIVVQGGLDASVQGATLDDGTLFGTDEIRATDDATFDSSELDGATGEIELVWTSTDGSRSQILSSHEYDVG